MKKQFTIGQAIRFGLGGAILAAAAFSSVTASAQSFECSASGGTERATVSVSTSNPNVCIRLIFAGSSVAPGSANCWDVAKANNLSCVDPVTGRVNMITVRQ